MPKEKKLTYRKCERCRKDRQKCTPADRVWPGRRCDRCLKYGYACSANKSKDQERDGTNEDTADRVPASRSLLSGDLKQMTDMQCVQEYDDIKALQRGYEILDEFQYPWGFADGMSEEAEEEYEEWVRLRKCDIVAEIQRRASQHEADRLYKEAEFLYRRIVATLNFPIEDVDESLVQGNLHKLVQAEINMGDFSTAERIQEYLLTKAYRHKIENGTGDLEELAEGFVGLHSLFVARMTGRGKFITLIAKVYILNRAMVLDIDALNRLLLQRQFCEVKLPNAGTLLHLAAYSDAVNLGGLLINGGADVDNQAEFGRTPLAGAALWRCACMVRLLLENKARMDLFDDEGDTALHGACRCLDASDREKPPYDDEHVSLRIVEMLVEGGVNINAKNIHAETALFTAIYYGHVRLASYLLDMGAWTEIRNDQQKQESRIAAMRINREPTLPLQMTPGVSPRMQARANSILHAAVKEGQHSVVRKLIDRGVDVNTIDGYYCRTALDWAQRECDKEMVQMLKEAGAVGPTTDSDEPQGDSSTSDALTAASSPDDLNTSLSDGSARG